MPNSKLEILKPLKTGSTIGIFGGGQLGRMTCHAAQNLGYETIVFSNMPDSPASKVTCSSIIADYHDEEALAGFAAAIDVATFEFENIPAASVEFVAQTKKIYPSAEVLKITQNRLNEKRFLEKNNIQVTPYAEITSLAELELYFKKFSEKAILKTATLGYDGKGQFTLTSSSNLEQTWQRAQGHQLILEKFADFDQEISVILARGINGEIACYEPLTNIHKNGILDQSFYPARINKGIAENARAIATKIASALDLVGVIAVEFFVLKNGDLLVNEMAPRPHNSGHFSLDASVTSQFEQLIRAITMNPLGSTEFHSVGHMKNLIGDDVNDLDQYLQNKRAKIHLYGKKEVAPGRKMGHVNLLINDQ